MTNSQQPREPVDVFYSYSHQDEKWRDKLNKHLSVLQNQGLIRVWHDRKIDAGDDWRREINKYLNNAQIILMLVSDDFFASGYCYSVEMKQALERHERGEARVIPIILRPVAWQSSPLANIQALPTDAKPVALWKNRDEAFVNITQGISQAIEGFIRQRAAQIPASGNNLSSSGQLNANRMTAGANAHRTNGFLKKLKPSPLDKTIWVALIGAVVAITAAYWQFVYKPANANTNANLNERVKFTGRVIDLDTQQAIQGAKVTVMGWQDLPHIQYTDSEGVFYLIFPKSVDSARLQIEARGYKPADRNVSVSGIGVEDIRLAAANDSSSQTAMPAQTPSAPSPKTNSREHSLTKGLKRNNEARSGRSRNKEDPYKNLNYNAP
jgi:hypothetical protein